MGLLARAKRLYDALRRAKAGGVLGDDYLLESYTHEASFAIIERDGKVAYLHQNGRDIDPESDEGKAIVLKWRRKQELAKRQQAEVDALKKRQAEELRRFEEEG